MNNAELVYSALCTNYSTDLKKCESNCLICGKPIHEGIIAKKVLSSNFTDYDVCKCINSKYVCKECTASIKNADLRRNNIISDATHCYLVKKNDIENYVFNLDKYVKGEFIVCITTSFKKHNVFKARVNTNTQDYFIRHEDKEFEVNVPIMSNLYKKLNTAYLQFSKDELQTGNYKIISIEQFGIEKFEEYENEFKKYRGSDQFNFLLFILNSEKRNEYIKQKQKEQKGNDKKTQKKSNKNGGNQLCMF